MTGATEDPGVNVQRGGALRRPCFSSEVSGAR